jgi:hypothetical protein
MYHYCTLGFYGKPPIGNISFYDGEVFTLEAAQETVETIEQHQREHPDWIVDTAFGPCKSVRAYLQGGNVSGRILWQLEPVHI